MRHPILPVLVSLLISSSACDAGSAAPPYAVQDSAGIRVIEVDFGQAETRFTVAREPEWTIGGEDGDGELVLHGVEDAVLLGSGEAVVAESSGQRIIRVELGSGESAVWGGPGDGPEEFRDLARVFDLGEGRIGAYDRARRRYVVIDENGAFVEEVNLGAVSEAREAPLLELVEDGAGEPAMYLAERSGLPAEMTEGPYRGVGPVVRFVPEDGADTLTTISGNTTFVAPGIGMGIVPFGATTLIAAGSSGLWIGDTEEPEALLWGDSAEPRAILRWFPAQPRTLTEERVRELWERLAVDVPEEQRGIVAELREAVPIPERVPAFGSLVVGSDGAVWIGGPIPPEVQMIEARPPPQDWLVVDLAAETVARAATPTGFRLLQVEEDLLIGVHVDEVGIETVRGYRLERGAPEAR